MIQGGTKMGVQNMYKGKKTISVEMDPFFGQVKQLEADGWSLEPTAKKVATKAPEKTEAPAEKEEAPDVKEEVKEVAPKLKVKKIKK